MAISIMLTFAVSQLESCKHEPFNLNNLPTICFEADVQPIYSTSCAMSGCHSGNSKLGDFDPANYSTLMQSVKPGDPWGSKAYTIVSSPNNPNMMPPKGHKALSPQQLTTIEVWILQGAKETKCDSSKISGVVNPKLQIESSHQTYLSRVNR